ncbi:hypothetical protein WA026_020644 [Henosepilachna vigintioctopunctata]|uniref:FAD dependent oxidoreductase domain-containing protein n=1 Tax=Henosepilachna vigintioctopunctata TaxID=420089 RepID=A0AAW1UBG5_9CUCU
MTELNIAVLGAGIVGLTTVLELKKEFRNATIDIIADKFYDETTSFVAAGIFRPPTGDFGVNENVTRMWIKNSYSYWDNLKSSSDAEQLGAKEVCGYIFSKEYPHIVRNKYLESLVPLYRQATDEELKMCPGEWKYGSYFSTLLIDPTKYLKWALNKAKNSDINIIKKKLESFSEIDRKYDILVNCTGFGGKILCGDSSIVPLRGQICKVRAPWIQNFFYGDNDTYIIPSFDNVTLGGCRQYDSYNTEVSILDYQAIRSRCENLLPSLKKAELISHRVGLRPHRIPLRMEKEYCNVKGAKIKIVHNYGHGGYGVTTAPGTALNAIQLVKEMLSERSKL